MRRNKTERIRRGMRRSKQAGVSGKVSCSMVKRPKEKSGGAQSE